MNVRGVSKSSQNPSLKSIQDELYTLRETLNTLEGKMATLQDYVTILNGRITDIEHAQQRITQALTLTQE